MRKENLIILLAMMVCLSGCTRVEIKSSEKNAIMQENTEDNAQKEEISLDYSCYDLLIDQIQSGLLNGFDNEGMQMDISSCFFTNTTYGALGYAKKDINNDGIKELILGDNGDGTSGSIIYDIYSINEKGELCHVLDGWERNRYYLCEDGTIANEGSNGADESTYVYYKYDSTSLSIEGNIIEAVIYDATADADNPWFYSNTSTISTNAKQITAKEAQEIRDAYKYVTIEFIPFESER